MKMELKFNQESIDRAEASIRDKLKATLKEPALLSEIAEVAITDIKFQARRGISTESGTIKGGAQTTGKFKALTPKWIKERQKIADATKTHETFKANRSNITITGQLLDAMSKVLTRTGIAIVFKGIHQPYQARRVRRDGTRQVGKPIPNEDLSGYVEQVRPFFAIRESLLPRLKNIVIRLIRRKL